MTKTAQAEAATAVDGPFAAMAAAMTAAMATALKSLPIDPLGAQAGPVLPSMAEALLGRIDGAPALAPLWDFDRKSAVASAAWWRLQQAQLEYRALLDGVWPQVQKTAARKQRAATPREGVELWLEALNQALLELMRTPRYLEAQRKTLDAGLAFREAMGAIATELCEWLQLPAREEVDDLARSLTELRRELRALRRPATREQRTTRERPTQRKQTTARTRNAAGRAGQ